MGTEIEKLQILLEAKADVRQAETEVGKLTGSVGGMLALFKGGLAVGAGIEGLKMLLKIPPAFKEAIGAGIDFNSMMERNQIALAAALRTGSPESFTTFNSALAASSGLFKDMRSSALDAGVDIRVVSEVMAAMTGIMTRAGVPLERQVRLTAALSGAVQTLGLKGQHLTEIRSLLTGQNLQSSMLAKVLNMDAESVNAAKESGRFFELMMERLNGFSEGATKAKQSYDGLWSRIKAIASETAGKSTEGLFSDAKTVMEAASKSGAPSAIGSGINDLYDTVVSVPKNLADKILELYGSVFDNDVRQRAVRRYAERNAWDLRHQEIYRRNGMFAPDSEVGAAEWRRKTAPGPGGVPVEYLGPPLPKPPEKMPITDQSTADWEFWTEEEKRMRDEAQRQLKDARSKNKSQFAGLASSLLGNLQAPSNQGFSLTAGMAAASNAALVTQKSMLNELVQIRLVLSRQSWGFEDI